MGLRDAVNNLGLRLALGRIAKEFPAMKNALAWLTAVPGRKRTLTAIAAISSVVLRHAQNALTEVCALGFAVTCGWKLDAASDAVGKLGLLVDGLTTGSDIVALGLGVWGLGHEWYRRRSAKS